MDELNVQGRKINVKLSNSKKKRSNKLKKPCRTEKRAESLKNNKKAVDILIREKISRDFDGGRQRSCRVIASKRLAAGRLKPKHLREGLFLKGLRSQYVKRDSKKETNEARRNEDINRIIDLGRELGDDKKANHSGLRHKHSEEKPHNKSLDDINYAFILDNKENTLNESNMDLDECTLSPIRSGLKNCPSQWNKSINCRSFQRKSATSTAKGNINTSSNSNSSSRSSTNSNHMKKKKCQTCDIDFYKEFEKFASNLEENSENEILLNLPKEGILEQALESLRSLYATHNKSIEVNDDDGNIDGNLGAIRTNPDKKEIFQMDRFLSAYELITKTSVPVSSTPGSNEVFNVKGSKPDDVFALTLDLPSTSHWAYDNINVNEFMTESLFPPHFNLENKDLSFSFEEEMKNANVSALKGLDFDTPQLQYYRRNMF